MADQIRIAVKDSETAEALQRELQSQGIRTRPVGHAPGLAFTGHYRFGRAEANLPPGEIIEIVAGIGPALVDGFFNTIERFSDRLQLFINGEPRQVVKTSPSAIPETRGETFEEFLRRVRSQ